jgi:preprotein translocase SecE subunit
MADTNDTAITNTPVVDHHGGLSIYKPGQGYYTRMGTVVGATMVSLLGILWLWSYLIKMRIGSLNPLLAAAGGSIIIGGLITFFVYYLVFVKPKSVDFLVATEMEMKKVNWSTRREVIGSTGAVIFHAIFLALFCWGLELAFVWFFQQIKVLES